MFLVRLAWLALAGLVACTAFVVAQAPYSTHNRMCQILYTDFLCAGTTLSRLGPWLIVVLAVPVVLCLAPVVYPHIRIVWTIAAIQVVLLIIGALVALEILPFPELASFIGSPIGLLGIPIAALQSLVSSLRRAPSEEELAQINAGFDRVPLPKASP